MKVLVVAPSFYPASVYGGPIFSTLSLCRGIVTRGHHVRVLTTDANGKDRLAASCGGDEISLMERLTVRYCRRYALDSVAPRMLVEIWRYVSWADIVHLTAVYSFPTFPTLIACRVLGRPLVWSPRGSLQHWEGSTRPALKHVWEMLCRVVRPAQTVLHTTANVEYEASEGRVGASSMRIIPNSIEIPREILARRPGEVLRLAYMGRLHPKKGIENLLHACASLLVKHFAWSLRLAGGGEPAYEAGLAELIRSLGLGDRVTMVGHITGAAKEDFFRDTDVVVLPSYSENFGIIVAEALAREIPVIASRHTPWARVEEKGCGLWVDNDSDSLADAIKTIRSRPLADMGRRGRKWMQEEYSESMVAAQMSNLYEELVAGK